MRSAAKNILYVVANSRAYEPENLNSGMAAWKKIMFGIDAAGILLMAFWLFRLLKKYKSRKAAE